MPDNLDQAGSGNRGRQSLEEEKLRLEIAKLKSETGAAGIASRVLWPILSSALTIALSLTALFLSLSNQQTQAERENETRRRASLDSSLLNATSDLPAKQIAGIWALSDFWKDKQFWPVLANTLSSILSIDRDPAVHLAAAQVIGNAITQETPLAETRQLRTLLYGNARTFQVGTVVRVNWLLRESLDDSLEDETFEPKLIRSNREKLAATGEAIRQNWEYLDDAHFPNTDLRGIELYDANLRRASFVKARLGRANFRGAHLNGANVQQANLHCADLAHADLEDLQNWRSIWNIAKANIHMVRNPPTGFIEWAMSRGAVDMDDENWKEYIRWQGCDDRQ